MKTLDLLVIHPNSGSTYQDLRNDLTAVEPPLWTRLIAGYALDHGYTVEIIDAEADNLAAWEIAQLVYEKKPRLTAVVVFGHQPSASTQMMPGALKILESIDFLHPMILIGGHVSALPEQSLRESCASFVCKGEGPETVVRLLQELKTTPPDVCLALETIPGLVWRKYKSLNMADPAWGEFDVVVNPMAPNIDPAKLTGNVWHLLPMDKYRAHNWQTFPTGISRQHYASVYTSLSCPFTCQFCCIAAPFGESGGYRLRAPAVVVEEILFLFSYYGVRTFKIIDEMFVLNAKHVREICEGIIALGIGDHINIWAYARVDTVKAGMLDLMRRAGIRWLALGIEAGSKAVRDKARKGLKSESIASIVQKIKDADICVLGNFIFGLPGDTQETMRETLDLAKELQCEFANFYAAQAYPGSQLYADAVASGAALPTSWSGYSQHSRGSTPLANENLTSADILAFRDKAFHEYFSHEPYLDMIEGRFGKDTRTYIELMEGHRLERDLLKQRFRFIDKHDKEAWSDTPEELVQAVTEKGLTIEDGKIIYYHNETDIQPAIDRLCDAFPDPTSKTKCRVRFMLCRPLMFAELDMAEGKGFEPS